jgi:hypothetical protein
MQRALLIAASMALAAGGAQGCDPYNVGSDCCNVFGKNCEGPCWNHGCTTECDKEKYGPDLKLSCPDSSGWYNCCPNGSKCKPQCDARNGGCCCTGAVVEIISMGQITYDWGSQSSAPDSTSTQVTLVNQGLNAGPTDASAPSLTTTVTNTQSSSWTFESTTKISTEAKVTAGVPFFGSGEVKFGAEQTFKYGTTKTSTNMLQVTIDTGKDTIPPMSRKVWEFAASMQVINVPFTAKAVATTDCGGTVDTQVRGTMKLSGIASFVQGRYSKLAGPTVPIECASPFGLTVQQQLTTLFCPVAPSDQCADNVLCKRAGLVSGTCCAPGAMSECCAKVEAHPSCVRKYPKGSVICPTASGFFDTCCFASSAKALAATNSSSSAAFDVHMRLDPIAREQETSTSAERKPSDTRAGALAAPPAAEHVVALNMTQERRRPSMR